MRSVFSRRDSIKCRSDRVFLWLVIAGAVQVGIVATRVFDGQSPPRASLSVGDTLRSFPGATLADQSATVDIASDSVLATVLYVFHPDCAHGLAVAPTWAEHFADTSAKDSLVRRIAVTSAPPSVSASYAKRFGWSVALLSVLPTPNAMHDFLGRTPWVFVFDSQGVLRHDGHGSELAAAEQAVRAAVRSAKTT